MITVCQSCPHVSGHVQENKMMSSYQIAVSAFSISSGAQGLHWFPSCSLDFSRKHSKRRGICLCWPWFRRCFLWHFDRYIYCLFISLPAYCETGRRLILIHVAQNEDWWCWCARGSMKIDDDDVDMHGTAWRLMMLMCMGQYEDWWWCWYAYGRMKIDDDDMMEQDEDW